MRLFFALWPPLDATDRLGRIARSWVHEYGGRPTRPETIHLTLVFLGEVSEDLLPAVIHAAQVVRETLFELTIDQLGYWRHNRLLWAGCASPSLRLQSLVGALKCSLRDAGIPFDDDKRIFIPHLTLVRKMPEARVPKMMPAVEPIPWPCSGFALVCSELAKGGSVYRTLAEFRLDENSNGIAAN